jgi:hypothetical protein
MCVGRVGLHVCMACCGWCCSLFVRACGAFFLPACQSLSSVCGVHSHVCERVCWHASCVCVLSTQIAEKIKYAKWKVLDITTALREGRVPQSGPVGGDVCARSAWGAGGLLV